MTKDQANELKRLIRRLELSLCNLDDKEADKDRTKLHREIDSLTQQPAELTDAELSDAIEKAAIAKGFMWGGTRYEIGRAVIAAHKEKQVKV